MRRTVTLANMPGDVSDILLVIIRELFGDAVADAFGPAHPPTESFAGFCSMIAAWGQRTAKGHAYAGRNLDWNKDLGLNKYKTVIVYRPNDGAHFHATVGYAPLWGAITGMSSQGLTVHEANLEENRITFEGVPWLLRLRLVMEQANNLKVSERERGRVDRRTIKYVRLCEARSCNLRTNTGVHSTLRNCKLSHVPPYIRHMQVAISTTPPAKCCTATTKTMDTRLRLPRLIPTLSLSLSLALTISPSPPLCVCICVSMSHSPTALSLSLPPPSLSLPLCL